MTALNIWNDTALRGWIAKFADGNGRTAELLCLALEKPLRVHAAALKPLETLPPDAPGWLKEKFRAASFHTFDPSLDPGLDEKIRHIRDWIAGAVASNADWTKEEKPKRLLHFKTVDDAMKAADKAMKKEALRLREAFKNNPAALDDENAKTVMVLEDGFRIVRLLTPEALDRESAAMGHCIGNGGYDKKLRDDRYSYYSLRDSLNNPHATLEVENSTLLQCKGKQNVPPENKYFPALRAFIEREKFLLAEEHAHTGLWQAPDGSYHSLRRLPPGAEVRGELNLSLLNDVVLPENLSVAGPLILNGADLLTLPEGLKANNVVHLWLKDGRYNRKDGPATINYNPETGVITHESWYRNGRLHREDGPAIVRRNPKTGFVIHERWFRNNLQYREDGPSDIRYDPETGALIREEWLLNDQIHREDGPAEIEYDPETGVVTKEEWRLNGQLHRENAPAYIERDPKTGVITEERWNLEGNRHREDAPAYIERHPKTGVITKEQWYLNGQLHHEDAPAYIERDSETGTVTRKEWWKNGQKINPPLNTIREQAQSLWRYGA